MGTAAAAITGATLQVGGGIIAGVQQRNAAKANAKMYEQEAAAIDAQKGIVRRQYAAKMEKVNGAAVATAARAGLKISGTVAESINQSLTNLNSDKIYSLHNLETQRINALNNAKLQRWQGRNAMITSILGGVSGATNSLVSYYGGNKT